MPLSPLPSSSFTLVYVTGIPQLRSTKKDSARRLVSLIDELYDYRVNLFVAAEVPLKDLFAKVMSPDDGERSPTEMLDDNKKKHGNSKAPDLSALVNPNMTRIAPSASLHDLKTAIRRAESRLFEMCSKDYCRRASLSGARDRIMQQHPTL